MKDIASLGMTKIILKGCEVMSKYKYHERDSRRIKNKNFNDNDDHNHNRNYSKNDNDNKDLAFNAVKDTNKDVTKNINLIKVKPKIYILNDGSSSSVTPQLVFDQGMFEGIGQDFELVSQVFYDFVGGLDETTPGHAALEREPLVLHASIPIIISDITDDDEVDFVQAACGIAYLLTKEVIQPSAIHDKNQLPEEGFEQEQEIYFFVDTSTMEMPKVTSFQYVDDETSLPALYRLYARVDFGIMDSTSEYSFTARQYPGRP